MTESKVLDKVSLVYGQMNEPPGNRLRVGLTGLTLAEYLRRTKGHDVLLFIDNIYRFTFWRGWSARRSWVACPRRSVINRPWPKR